MRQIEIKISGFGTLDQIATRLIDIGRELQVINIYTGEIPDTFEDEILCTEIREI